MRTLDFDGKPLPIASAVLAAPVPMAEGAYLVASYIVVPTRGYVRYDMCYTYTGITPMALHTSIAHACAQMLAIAMASYPRPIS